MDATGPIEKQTKTISNQALMDYIIDLAKRKGKSPQDLLMITLTLQCTIYEQASDGEITIDEFAQGIKDTIIKELTLHPPAQRIVQ